jgi:hypothetical protein
LVGFDVDTYVISLAFTTAFSYAGSTNSRSTGFRIRGFGKNATTSIGVDSSTFGAREAYAYVDGGYSTNETTRSNTLATYAPTSGAS